MITGAGRNIGRAIALDLASGGMDIVVVVRRNREEAEGVAGEVRALGRRAMVGVTDVRDEEAISGVVERAREELAPVNVLVNNAAVRREAPFLELPVAEWREYWTSSSMGRSCAAGRYCRTCWIPGGAGS